MEPNLAPVRLRGVRAVVLGFLVFTAACGGVPSRAPDITGQVTRVSAGASGSVVILVEEMPGEQTESKISVTVDTTTRVMRDTDTGRVEGTLEDLRGALVVSVWIEGPMAMSYPAQGRAEAVLIRSPR